MPAGFLPSWVAQATSLYCPATRRTEWKERPPLSERLSVPMATVVPVGGSPTGAGGSPALPILQTGSKGWTPNKRFMGSRMIFRSFLAVAFALAFTTSAQAQLKVGTANLRKIFEGYYKTKQADQMLK